MGLLRQPQTVSEWLYPCTFFSHLLMVYNTLYCTSLHPSLRWAPRHLLPSVPFSLTSIALTFDLNKMLIKGSERRQNNNTCYTNCDNNSKKHANWAVLPIVNGEREREKGKKRKHMESKCICIILFCIKKPHQPSFSSPNTDGFLWSHYFAHGPLVMILMLRLPIRTVSFQLPLLFRRLFPTSIEHDWLDDWSRDLGSALSCIRLLPVITRWPLM